MKKLILIIPFLCFLFSCETVVEIDLEEHTPKLVVYGFLNPLYDQINVTVTSSVKRDANVDPPFIENATVELYENGLYIGNATYAVDPQNYRNYVLVHQLDHRS